MSSIERAMERARRIDVTKVAAERREDTAPHEPAEDGGLRQRPRPGIELDLPLLRARGFLTPDSDHREMHEQYRMVKRPLLGHAFSEGQLGPNTERLIQVTSSIDGEGKTFTVFNLAMSIAMELDFTVVMVDADLTRRSLTALVGLDGRTGLTDILRGETADVGEAIFRTNVPRLSVLPAGHTHPRASELIASDVMRRVTQEMATRYADRVLLFDSTPLLMDSQATTLAGHMGQVLVVVEAGRTSENVVRNGLDLLDQNRTRVGLMLNKSPRGYGYGYYGGYYW